MPGDEMHASGRLASSRKIKEFTVQEMVQYRETRCHGAWHMLLISAWRRRPCTPLCGSNIKSVVCSIVIHCFAGPTAACAITLTEDNGAHVAKKIKQRRGSCIAKQWNAVVGRIRCITKHKAQVWEMVQYRKTIECDATMLQC
jgi:hypothetical protein